MTSAARASSARHATTAARASARATKLERNPVAALEVEHLPRLVGGGDLERQAGQDFANARDLVGVALGELAAAEPQAVFEADAHVGAHDRRHRDQRQL